MYPLTRCSWSALFRAPYATSGSSGCPVLVCLGPLGDRVDEVVVDARTGQHAGRRGAVLAGVEVARVRDRLRGLLQVGVVEDDHRRLAAELEVGALELPGRGRRDLHPGPDRTGDRDQLRDLVVDQRTAGVAVTADDVEHARRQELVAQFGEQHRRRRGGVARLEHHCVAGGQGRRDLPDRHHQRVVPRRHLTDDADRLAPDPRRVAGQVLTRRPPFQHPGRTGEEPQLVDTRRHLVARGQRQRLAGVPALHLDELVRPPLHRVRDPQQRAAAARPACVSRQVSKARAAAVIAWSTSSGPDNGACA